MSKKTRNLTLCALFSALSVVSLYFASIWPTGQLGFAAISSLFVAATVIEMGITQGILVFIISAALGMLIVPDKAAPFLFILFFGYYPIIKNLAERITARIFQWIFKLAVFNASLSALIFLLRNVFPVFSLDMLSDTVLYVCGNVVFILFDYGYSKLIQFYLSRISKLINKL